MPSLGRILVQVFTSRSRIPISDATVAITQKEGARHRLIAAEITDESGKTAPVELPTPPPAESEAPGVPNPFAVCDVWVAHPEYQRAYLEDVQIFPDQLTLQPIELVPRPEHTGPEEFPHTVHITPQPL